MNIHIETASSSPRGVVRFLNGLLLLRYALVATQDTDDINSLANIYFQRSVRLFSSEAVGLLNQLGALTLPSGTIPGAPPGSASSRIGDDRSPLEQFPFSSFPLEGFALETLLTEPINDQGFNIVSLEQGSIDLVIEVGLDLIKERLKKMLGQALDIAQSETLEKRQINRRTSREAVGTTVAESPVFATIPGRETTAGLLMIGVEATQGGLSDMGATSATFT